MALNHINSTSVQHTSAEQCTCSRWNSHLFDLNDWSPDPACPRHGIEACLRLADPTLDIDEDES